MFYLKYRPQKIAEIDNGAVRETIKKLLHSKQIPHALLFAGPKGSGKTSTARIVAKSLNCQRTVFSGHGQTIEPCNQCSNCLMINNSSSVDVVEIDAASNRKIDEIRKLINEVSFSPMTGHYRVFIIDEAHMITKDAFNAFLKTLEEPPESVIFILATTNPEKLPKTILSRLYRIEFGNIVGSDIERMLDRIAKKEKINLDLKVKKLIVSQADRSFRDAAKILENLSIQNLLKFNQAEKYLGSTNKLKLLAIIDKGDLSQALNWINGFSEKGGNIKKLIEELLQILRKQLFVAVGSQPISQGQLRLNLSEKKIFLLIKLLNEAYRQLFYSPIESLPLELAITEFYNEEARN